MISEIEGEFKAMRAKVQKSRGAIRRELHLMRGELDEFSAGGPDW